MDLWIGISWGYLAFLLLALVLLYYHPLAGKGNRASVGGIIEIIGAIFLAPLYDLLQLIMFFVRGAKV